MKTLITDIGAIITATMSTTEVQSAIDEMSPAQKYHLLMNHNRPSLDYIFPVVYMNRCNRSFKYHWLQQYSWLRYSSKLDAVFCINCCLFVRERRGKGTLVNTPFCKWTKTAEVLKEHNKHSYHSTSMTDAKHFKLSVETPDRSINVILDIERQARITDNRHILKMVTKAVLHCARQCIGLRGKVEHVFDDGVNPGNFLATLKLLSESDPLLRQHLEKPSHGKGQYLSAGIQNDMINILGNMIRDSILADIRAAQFYTIMADEVESHNREQMPLCIRFLGQDNVIREEFMEFICLERITGGHISAKILQWLADNSLETDKMRGQCYDGASNMSSEKVGVQKRIRESAPLAVYTHCSSHCLNLVLVHSCKIPAVRNMIDIMRQICVFFNSSPKRQGLLTQIITTQETHPSRRKPLLQLCKTRWTERHEAYQHFYQAYFFIVKSLELIAHKLHQDLVPNIYLDGWDTDSRAKASGMLKGMTSFEFLMTFIVTYMTLSNMAGLARKLQSSTIDIFEAYSMVSVHI